MKPILPFSDANHSRGRYRQQKALPGLIQEGDKQRMVFKGLETVAPTGRRWPSSFSRSFTCASSQRAISGIRARNHRQADGGRMDARLVYRKRLRRPLSEYQRMFRLMYAPLALPMKKTISAVPLAISEPRHH